MVNACRLGQPPSITRSEMGGFAETFLRGGAAAFVGCPLVGRRRAGSVLRRDVLRRPARTRGRHDRERHHRRPRGRSHQRRPDLARLHLSARPPRYARLAGRPAHTTEPPRHPEGQQRMSEVSTTTSHTITQNGGLTAGPPGLGRRRAGPVERPFDRAQRSRRPACPRAQHAAHQRAGLPQHPRRRGPALRHRPADLPGGTPAAGAAGDLGRTAASWTRPLD